MNDDATDKADRHERVRFRRDEIVDLSAMPSAVGETQTQTHQVKNTRPKRSFLRRASRYVLISTITLCLLVALAVGGLTLLANSRWGAERLRIETEKALEAALGQDLDVSVSNVNFSLLGPGLLNLSLNDLDISQAQTQQEIIQAAAIKFGVQLWPLVTGKLWIESASLDQARIVTWAVPTSDGGDALKQIYNADGIIEPDLLLEGAFDAVDAVVKAIGSGGAPNVQLTDIDLEFGVRSAVDKIKIKQAALKQTGQKVDLDGVGLFGQREIEFSASADRAHRRSKIDKFNIEFRSRNQPAPVSAMALGDTLVAVAANRLPANGPPNLRVSMGARSFALDLGTRGKLAGSLNLAAVLAKGSAKIEVERLNADIGNSRYRMNGAFGPRPKGEADGAPPSYRYEFISNESVLAPTDITEPPMPMGMRLAGEFRPDIHRLAVDDLSIASASGQATGKAALTFDGAKPPGIDLRLNVLGLSVANVKQLWPWIAAESARRWVNANLTGGTVPEGVIQLSVPAGRLGNGKRLTNEEVFGNFKVVDTSVHTAGDIPQIVNTIGEVKFAGDDVNISLDSGRAAMSGGQFIDASAGTLVIKDAGVPPVYGQLSLSLAGPARALAELASVKPIDVMGKTGIAPDTLSGNAQGHVEATIPLNKTDRSKLNWKIDLAYKGLAMSKPIQGQTISGATGTLVIDKSSVTLLADAKLNGLPAKLRVIEPIGAGSPVKRERKVSVSLDQTMLDKAAPGLKSIVGGAIKADIDVTQPGRTSVDADLAAATIDIPGIGWSKGKGIPARAKFDMVSQGSSMQLSNFNLSGKTFSASGAININSGAFSSAKFDNVELNRGDKFKVSIDKSGPGYSIVANGAAFDGRAFIKQATSAQRAQGGKSSGPAISVKATIGQLTGFNDETLRNVSLDLSGSGKGDLSLEGKTDSGKPVSIATRRGGDISVYSEDAGDLLRFMNIYPRVSNGVLRVKLKARSDGSYAGDIDADRFSVVNEPKFRSLVSSSQTGGQSLDEAFRGKVDISSVRFDRGHATIQMGSNYLNLVDGILRGPEFGATFKGVAYDAQNRMSMTGTFMPAYGLNSLFGDIPVLGALLGNGNEGGLIGVTYKLTGPAKSPQLQVNPLSIIAPGIFRSIFEFH